MNVHDFFVCLNRGLGGSGYTGMGEDSSIVYCGTSHIHSYYLCRG